MRIIKFIIGPYYSLLRKQMVVLIYVLRNPSVKIEGKCNFKNVNFSRHNYVSESKVFNTQLGKYSYVATGCNINNCTIGNYTCIGPKVQIGLGEHPTDLFSVHPVFYRDTSNLGYNLRLRRSRFTEYRDVNIGSDVWIGANVIVRSGVSIGNGSIIAAGSVVTKNVEPFTVIGGVPAKLIRQRFPVEIKERLEKSNWWDKDLEYFNMNKRDCPEEIINNV